MNFLNVLRGPSSYISKESLSGARQFILGVEEYWGHSTLDEFVIEGIKTTIPFHMQLMQDKSFREGNYTTKFLETFHMK